MTKRVMVSIILLILSLSIAIGSYWILQKQFSSLGEALNNAIYTDLPAIQSAQTIKVQWQNSRKILHIFILHSEIADLQVEIETLPDLVNQPKQYKDSCIRCLHLLRGAQESVELSMANIL